MNSDRFTLKVLLVILKLFAILFLLKHFQYTARTLSHSFTIAILAQFPIIPTV